ncbi:MAG: hypothetical protein GY757_53710 [bacterium]|nr:hypothetical protein [bacterium]
MPDMDQMKNCAVEPGRVTAQGFSPEAPFSWSIQISDEIWNDPKNLMVTLSRFKQSVADVIGYQYESRLRLRFINPVIPVEPALSVPGRVVIDYVP